jgi:oxamate amidohydrolase
MADACRSQGLLEDAIRHSREGVAVTRSLHDNTAAKLRELAGVPGFAETYLSNGDPLAIAGRLRQERLAATLEHLGRAGLNDFYTGDLARSMSRDLEAVGSPIRLADLEAHQSEAVTPLSLEVAGHRLYNMPPPTQGLASLLLLGLYAQRQAASADGFDFVHRLVECTKAAFRVRDRHVSDPEWMTDSAESFLTDESLARLGADISHDRAAPWPHESAPGDTVWLGAADRSGLCVSYIQSIYWEFGSGVILPGSGVTWQNRGASFSLEASHPNRLEPRRLPFHTIQPALAELVDGRMMVYGTMGGEGQPQTQAAIFARHVMHGVPLQAAVTAPRWLLGRTWGAATTTLKIEDRFDPAVIEQLRASGHDIEVVEGFADIMGHAGAIVLHPDGLMEGASDPRSDGAVATR